jgi:hypothetical protein
MPSAALPRERHDGNSFYRTAVRVRRFGEAETAGRTSSRNGKLSLHTEAGFRRGHICTLGSLLRNGCSHDVASPSPLPATGTPDTAPDAIVLPEPDAVGDAPRNETGVRGATIREPSAGTVSHSEGRSSSSFTFTPPAMSSLHSSIAPGARNGGLEKACNLLCQVGRGVFGSAAD